MMRALERGGYGTSSNTHRVRCGSDLAAALLGLGIALLIWELSVRHNVRH